MTVVDVSSDAPWLSVPVQLGDRNQFPSLEPRAYLAHAGISPLSEPARMAAMAIMDDYCRHGMNAFGRWISQRTRLRERIARFIHARADDLAFFDNTTRGVIAVATCLDWKHGDRVVLFEGEFPSNVTPWQQAARTHALHVSMIPRAVVDDGDEAILAAVRAELARRVRLVAVSAVQFQTGRCMPLRAIAELCHAHGAELFVDAVQAVGVVPIDVTALGVDYLACGSHKWLMGLEGAGFLYVHPSRIEGLRPRMAGWLSHENALAFLFEGEGHLRYDRPIRARARTSWSPATATRWASPRSRPRSPASNVSASRTSTPT